MSFISSLIILSATVFSQEVGLKTDYLALSLVKPELVAVIDSKMEVFPGLAIHRLLGKDAVADEDASINPANANVLPVAAPRFPIKKETATSSPVITSGAGLVIAEDNETVLFEKSVDESWSIASITKLMTAMVFLEHNPGWDKVYEMKKSDRREGGRIYVYSGEKVKVKDLFYLSLVGSANSETIALISAAGFTETQFVELMNQKAKALGLERTVFEDAVGLSEKNVSTAREVAELAKAALALPDIAKATLNESYDLVTLQGRKKKIYSTDELLSGTLSAGTKILGGKTGFIEKAGYCFVGKFSDPAGHAVISVVLGEADKDSRFSKTNDLVGWSYDSYRWE